MPLTTLLPLRGASIWLRFAAPVGLRFFHQPALTAWLRTLMDGKLSDEPRLWIEAPDSGRQRFQRGDSYHFQVWVCAGGEQLLDELLARLRRLPGDRRPARQPFGAHLKLTGVFDRFDQRPVECAADLYAYAADALARETAFYREHNPIALRWLAPARLLLPKDQRQQGSQQGGQRGDKTRSGEQRYIRDRGQLSDHPELLGQRLYDSLAALLRATGDQAPPRAAIGVRVTDDDIGWYDAAYGGRNGQAKPMGGIVGRMELRIDDPDVLPLLVLGQYTGLGQRRAFGWGRYRLETPDGHGTVPQRRPARSVAQRAADPANLELAWRKLTRRSDATDYDDYGEAAAALAFAEQPGPVDELLDEIATALRDGSYQPPPLHGALLRREGRAPRPLAIPPFADRVAQRAIMQILAADLESLFADASYGFRRGISRHDARDRLTALRAEGYEWLLEADIEDFFDSVPHQRLENRLRSLLPDEPAIDLVMAWIAAPVLFDGHRVERAAGLPQGSPISPLLANLMLEDFDTDLHQLGFKLVRFADDFVIACRSRERAEAAAERVRRSLAEIDLAVNPDKTRITHFDRGFKFLGFTFLGGMVLDTPRRARATGHSPAPLQLAELPPASWLAQLARREPTVLQRLHHLPRRGDQIIASGAEATPAADPAADSGANPTGPSGTTLCANPEHPIDEPGTLLVATEGCLLATRAGRLSVTDPGGSKRELPWQGLGAVLLLGRQRLTGPAISAALEAGVSVHFATRSGRYQGLLSNGAPGPAGHGLWLRQQQRLAEPDAALELARALVAARIHNQCQVLRQRLRHAPELDRPLGLIQATAEQLPSAADAEQLRGFEGVAARYYYGALGSLIDPEFGFQGRKRRPPPDPFNALLSLGYTLLYQRADTVLRCAGLLPWQGFYHQGRGRHAALASDLMECFRHLVERQALTLLRRNELRPDDFVVQGRGCRLQRDALKRYLEALSYRFITPVTGADGVRGAPYDHLWRLARQLIARIDDPNAPFTPFRVR